MTWVIRNGELVKKWTPYNPARSNLPCPNIIRDGLPEPLQHQANGRWYDSKRAMEKADRETGCVCVGNTVAETSASIPPPPITKDEVVEAYQKVKQGYKPQVQTDPNLPNNLPKSGWI